MVDSKRYVPSNKRFEKHTQSFVEGKTMKGHLVDDKKNKNSYKVNGILKKVNKNALASDGWYVTVEEKILKCYYGDVYYYLPPHTVNGDWYIPTSKCEVEVSINEKSGIKTITKIKDAHKQLIAMDNKGMKLSGNGTSSVQIKENTVNISGDSLNAQNEITIDTTKHEDLPNEIKITDMYREIQELKDKVSDNNVS